MTRTTTRTALLLAALAAAFLAGRVTAPDPAALADDDEQEPPRWPVLDVTDGDTLDVRYRPPEPIEETLRLLNIDTASGATPDTTPPQKP